MPKSGSYNNHQLLYVIAIYFTPGAARSGKALVDPARKNSFGLIINSLLTLKLERVRSRWLNKYSKKEDGQYPALTLGPQ